MVAMVLIWSFLDVAEVSMDRLGLYKDTHLTLFKTSAGYLLNSTGEGVAVLFSADGRVLGRYGRRGQGPGEFNRQYVLAVEEKGIFICSNGRYILGFDHELKPIASSLPNFPGHLQLNTNYGLSRQPGTILVALAGREYLFAEIQRTGGSWTITQEHLPTGTGNTFDGRSLLGMGKRALVHGDTVFAARLGVSQDEDAYEIGVYSEFLGKHGSQDLSLVLSAEVRGFPLFAGMRALIYSAAKTPEGYVVELFTHLRSGGRNLRWHDYFSSDGGFLGRVNMDGARLLPVINSPEVFLLRDNGEIYGLKKIH